MASELLSEGIRQIMLDQEKLEEKIKNLLEEEIKV